MFSSRHHIARRNSVPLLLIAIQPLIKYNCQFAVLIIRLNHVGHCTIFFICQKIVYMCLFIYLPINLYFLLLCNAIIVMFYLPTDGYLNGWQNHVHV